MGLPRRRLTASILGLLLSGIGLYLMQRGSRTSQVGIGQIVGDLGAWSLERDLIADSPPQQPPFGAVVAAGKSDTDFSWMYDNSFNQTWDIYAYNVDDAHAQDVGLQIPKNKGREAMVYLTYIIDNYDSLPWMSVFVHGHLKAWHQDQPVDLLINHLNRNALAREGYISLRCDWYPSCPAEIRPHDHDTVVWGPGILHTETEQAIAGNWRLIFPNEPLPKTIASPCCAQFAVTRKAIRRRPKADFVKMRDWLLNTDLVDGISGRVFEKLWAYIFTGKAVHCPAPQKCACEWFGDCVERDWRWPPDGLPRLPSWP